MIGYRPHIGRGVKLVMQYRSAWSLLPTSPRNRPQCPIKSGWWAGGSRLEQGKTAKKIRLLSMSLLL
ncbi:MAG: hypothetical protein ACR2RE_25375, partial [Geminicoccaceae bacterium]